MHQSYRLCQKRGSRKLLLLVQPEGIDEAVGDKGFWLFFGLLFLQPGHIAVILRREADFLFKQGTEGAKAFKTHLVAHLAHGLVVVAKQLLGFFQPLPGNVLVGRTLVDMGKQPVKVKT